MLGKFVYTRQKCNGSPKMKQKSRSALDWSSWRLCLFLLSLCWLVFTFFMHLITLKWCSIWISYNLSSSTAWGETQEQVHSIYGTVWYGICTERTDDRRPKVGVTLTTSKKVFGSVEREPASTVFRRSTLANVVFSIRNIKSWCEYHRSPPKTPKQVVVCASVVPGFRTDNITWDYSESYHVRLIQSYHDGKAMMLCSNMGTMGFTALWIGSSWRNGIVLMS